MKRKLNEKQLEELNTKYEWCKTIQEFENSKYGDYSQGELMKILNQTFEDQDLVGMRYIYNDDNERSRYSKPAELEELNAILREKFGEDLAHNRQKDLAKIKRIIKRGKINNEDEFRLLKGRIDELLEESQFEEAQLLDKLMFEFEESLRPKDK